MIKDNRFMEIFSNTSNMQEIEKLVKAKCASINQSVDEWLDNWITLKEGNSCSLNAMINDDDDVIYIVELDGKYNDTRNFIVANEMFSSFNKR